MGPKVPTTTDDTRHFRPPPPQPRQCMPSSRKAAHPCPTPENPSSIQHLPHRQPARPCRTCAVPSPIHSSAPGARPLAHVAPLANRHPLTACKPHARSSLRHTGKRARHPQLFQNSQLGRTPGVSVPHLGMNSVTHLQLTSCMPALPSRASAALRTPAAPKPSLLTRHSSQIQIQLAPCRWQRLPSCRRYIWGLAR